jgi:hypothetical protein
MVCPNASEFDEALRLANRARSSRAMARAIRSRQTSVLFMTVGDYERSARKYERAVRIIADRAISEGSCKHA